MEIDCIVTKGEDGVYCAEVPAMPGLVTDGRTLTELRERLAEAVGLYLEDIAEAIGISPTYLSRLFKKEAGICLQDAIHEERVFRAANLLLYSELSLTEIAQYVGFPNQSYMGKVFKKLRNITPMAYRDRFKNRESEV